MACKIRYFTLLFSKPEAETKKTRPEYTVIARGAKAVATTPQSEAVKIGAADGQRHTNGHGPYLSTAGLHQTTLLRPTAKLHSNNGNE
jgi:hypothetical protein